MVTLNHDKVLLVVEQERDALCLMQALENSNRLALVWRARDSAEAVFYLQGSGAYRNRDRYPQPDVIVTGLRGPAAAKVLRVAQELTHCPLVVQLTATHDISQSLKSMSDGADCSQGKPNGRGETIAFVHWLEDWVEMLKAPGKQRTRMLFKVAGSLMTLSQQAMRATRAQERNYENTDDNSLSEADLPGERGRTRCAGQV